MNLKNVMIFTAGLGTGIIGYRLYLQNQDKIHGKVEEVIEDVEEVVDDEEEIDVEEKIDDIEQPEFVHNEPHYFDKQIEEDIEHSLEAMEILINAQDNMYNFPTDNEPDNIYRIPEEEFLNSDNEIVDLAYYVQNDTLTTYEDEVVGEPKKLIGVDNLRLEQNEEGDNSVYIRDDDKGIDYVVEIIDAMFGGL